MACASKCVVGEWELKVAEAMATAYGLQLAIDLYFSRVIAESDCETIIGYLVEQTGLQNAIGVALTDCGYASSLLSTCRWMYSPRRCNMAAHSLVVFCHGVESEFVWIEDVPSVLASTISTDAVLAF